MPNISQNQPQSPKTKNRSVRGLIVTMWIVFCAAFAGLFLFLYLVYNGVVGYMPPVEELKNPTDRFASVLYSADGKEIGRYFVGTGNRVYADFDEVSQHVIDALISTEDVRFDARSWSCAFQDCAYGQQECRRRIYAYPAARQAAVFS